MKLKEKKLLKLIIALVFKLTNSLKLLIITKKKLLLKINFLFLKKIFLLSISFCDVKTKILNLFLRLLYSKFKLFTGPPALNAG